MSFSRSGGVASLNCLAGNVCCPRLSTAPARSLFIAWTSQPSSTSRHQTDARLCFSSTRRNFTQTTFRKHSAVSKDGKELQVTFLDKEGGEHKFLVSEGENLLDIAQTYDLGVEGACGGSCACSTCHMIAMSEEFYNKFTEPTEDENDMLDQALGITATSRLGCQIKMTRDLDGLKVRLPVAPENIQAAV